MPATALNFFGVFAWLNFLNFFKDAHHFVIERLTSISALFVTYIEAPKPDNSGIYLARLVEHVVKSALHNAAQATYAPRCSLHTRLKVCDEIMDWVTDEDREDHPKKFLWLSGAAGAGKTAIAGAIADTCERQGRLAATFFFSSVSADPLRQSKARFISTLAYQLRDHYPAFNEKLLAAIERDPIIFDRRLEEQFRALIIEPVREAMKQGSAKLSSRRQILLVDGLDECTADPDPAASSQELRRRTEMDHDEILAVLWSAVEDHSSPFRILVASRPEANISQFFSAKAPHVVELFLDGKYDPNRDIKAFLESKFAEIRHRYDIPDDWPTEDMIEVLVLRASGQFIYAAVAIRFVEDVVDPPQKQLKTLLDWSPESTASSSSRPFDSIDALYTRILERSPQPKRAVKWILAIDQLRKRTPRNRTILIQFYLESLKGETKSLLGHLNSLIHVHINTNTSDLALFDLHHQSLLDFLADPGRSGQLYVDQVMVERFLEERWKKILRNRGPPCFGPGATIPQDFFELFLSLSKYQPQVVTREERMWLEAIAGTVILLLGNSGVGKSHFVNVAAESAVATVCDSLTPPYEELRVRSFALDQRNTRGHSSTPVSSVILVDTPGFDSVHTGMTDSKILEMTTEFLEELKRRRPGLQFGGVIFFQDITVDRATRQGVARLTQAWDDKILCRSVVVSTKWDRLPAPSYFVNHDARESDLATSIWRVALQRGARMGPRYDNTADSAWLVISQVLEAQPLAIDVLQKGLERVGLECKGFEKAYKSSQRRLIRRAIFA